MLKKLLIGTLGALVVLASIVVYRTAMFTPPEETKVGTVPHAVDAQAVASRLAQAIQIATISQQPPAPTDTAPLDAFIAWLEKTYPAVHEKLARERIGGHTLLYKWE